jgi:hypothetical protein
MMILAATALLPDPPVPPARCRAPFPNRSAWALDAAQARAKAPSIPASGKLAASRTRPGPDFRQAVALHGLAQQIVQNRRAGRR